MNINSKQSSRSIWGRRKLGFERLEDRRLMALPPAAPDPNVFATAAEVDQLLRRAVAASARDDAIIAIVDRNGTILGVHVEADVPIVDTATLGFAIDGAVAKARTAAFFSNNGGGGTALTSRTIQQISQSTVTQREVQANPNPTEVDPTKQGPGFVAPIGLGGHFPAGVAHTPPVDLFAIEHTNRAVRGANGEAYNADPLFVAADIPIPEAYGVQSGTAGSSTIGRGIGTLLGGIPLFKNSVLVGGIGVFYPGTTGYADFEQNFNFNNKKQTQLQRLNSPLGLEAEWVAFAAAGGSTGVNARVGALSGVPPVPGYDVPLSTKARIFLVGITLDQVGQTAQGGAKQTLQTGQRVGREPAPVLGGNVDVMPGMLTINGAPVPTGVLITPHSGNGLTAAQVEQIITQAIVQARNVRSAIRLPVGGATSRMVLGVSDLDGEVLGLYRMTDSTIFSIDVAVAKSRNVTYYASADLQPFDRVRVNDPTGPFLPLGVAFTNRTFRFLAEPRFPAGVDGSLPGKFSILRESWVDRRNGYNLGAPVAKSAATITTVLAYDAFFVGTNFHDPNNPDNQNGVVFFPGSSPLYIGGILVGGFGVSGDGVDQDDVVTVSGQAGFAAPLNIRADRFFVRKVRLPYQKFDRNALRGSVQSHGGDQHVSSQRSF